MTYEGSRRPLNAALMTASYGALLTTPESIRVLRHHPRHEPATISDRELGVAALLLLLAVVLAVVFVPGLI